MPFPSRRLARTLLVTAVALAAGCGESSPTARSSAPPIGTTRPIQSDAGHPAVPDADADAGPPAPEDPRTGRWLPGFGAGGLNGGPHGAFAQVNAITRGPDGGLYVGGIFSDAAGEHVKNVARWTGSKWEPLGTAFDGAVIALEFDTNGKLWALHEHLGTDHFVDDLARWDGASWTVVTRDIDRAAALAVVQGGVAVVGSFAKIDSATATGIALYGDDGAWHGVGAGGIEPGALGNADVGAIAKTADGFCVLGTFGKVGGVAAENTACWNGATWAPLGQGLPQGPGDKYVLKQSPTGQWFAGGSFGGFDANTGEATGGALYALEGGTWQLFQGDVTGDASKRVRAIAFETDSMLVGGLFAGAGTVRSADLVRWSAKDGWTAAAPVSGIVGVTLLENPGVYAIEPDGNASWIGGMFTTVGNVSAANIARVQGDTAVQVAPTDYKPLGVNGSINAVVTDRDGSVIAGGQFVPQAFPAIQNLARFDGRRWLPVGGGVTGRDVSALLVRRDGSLVVGGEFDGVGTQQAQSIAIWNGTAWSTLAHGVRGDGQIGSVRALVEDDQGNLYVGGLFLEAGGVSAHNIARWDGKAWTALGEGFDDSVDALAWTNGKLVAGGTFEQSGSTKTPHLAVWDGSSWQMLGGGADGYVETLAVSPKLGLVAGGFFDKVGGNDIPHLAAWDGAAWHAIGDGLQASYGGDTDPAGAIDLAMIWRVYSWNDGLFALGTFQESGKSPMKLVAYWDGTRWNELDGGLGDLGNACAVSNNRLYVGGVFSVVGHGLPSLGIGVWDFSGIADVH
jgi:hypothetical protein